jgi:LmbE family N-acetylglucosaminyl deacetylase
VALATRSTLARVREAELRTACQRLGVAHVDCWDYSDGALTDVDRTELEDRIEQVIRSFHPDIVFTFGLDGAYGHPDHVAISEATTAACVRLQDPAYFAEPPADGLETFAPPHLYHAAFPARRALLQDHLVEWLVAEGPDFRGDPEFAYALLLLAEEATALHSVEDHYAVKWFPAGFPIVEQGEPATSLYLLLSGHADVIRENQAGERHQVVRLMPGQFFGEQGIAAAQPRNAHVVAAEAATCLVLSPRQPTLFEGRGAGSRFISKGRSGAAGEDVGGVTTRIEIGEFLHTKLNALAAYRSQFPLRPDMLPESIFRDLIGVEYFTRMLPPPELETDLGESESSLRGGAYGLSPARR